VASRERVGVELVVELVVEPAARAFVEVGTFVALLLALVAAAERRSRGALTDLLLRHHRLGPLLGALLGAVPGCGSAIVVMPLYLRGTVSFGTVVATLVATMGDASFVVIAAAPTTAAWLHLGLVVVGAATGVLVDGARIAPARSATLQRVGIAPGAVVRSAAGQGGDAGPTGGRDAAADGVAAEAREGAAPTRAVRRAATAFWVLVTLGAALALADLAGTAAPGTLGPPAAAAVVGVGALGMVGCLVLVVAGRPLGPALGRSVACARGSLGVPVAREAAVVTGWVAVAFVALEVALAATGFDLAAVPSVGLLGVVVGAALGLVPGCGPQLVLASLYVQGVVPLPMLVANALSQDGDALLPLLVLDRRAAVLATAISTLPGLAVGSVLVLLGVG
jgi:hypothetical protein